MEVGTLTRRLVPVRARPAARRVARLVERLRYRGEGVFCPCCGGHFRSFADAAAGTGNKRPGARCPGCGAWERHRALVLFLERETPLFSAPLRLLHVAPEPVLRRRFLEARTLDYVSIDLESPLADLRMDVCALALPDEAFDCVLCLHVLEHVPDDRRAMRELARVLRDGGWGVIQCPIKRTRTEEDPSIVSPRERERVFGQADHVRRYGADFVDRLEAAGFRVEAVDYARRLDEEEARRYGLVPGEEMHVVSKPEPVTPDAGRPIREIIVPTR